MGVSEGLEGCVGDGSRMANGDDDGDGSRMANGDDDGDSIFVGPHKDHYYHPLPMSTTILMVF